MLQGGSLLDLAGSVVKGPTHKKIVVRAEEMEPSKAMGFCCDSVGEGLIFDDLFSKIANFNGFMGLLIVGSEKKISSFMRNGGTK